MPANALPTLEALRASGATPHYFGLGFIQLKLNEAERLHFWVPEWPTIPGAEHELHDHRYDFESTVLCGTLVHELYAVGALMPAPEPGALEVVAVSCTPDAAQAPHALGFAHPMRIGRFTVPAGSTYALGHEAVHRSWVEGPTVTRVRRGAQVKAMARVLREPGSAHVCPFSLPYTAEDCWARMAQLLTDAR